MDQGSNDTGSNHSEQCFCRECTKYGPPDPHMNALSITLATDWKAEAESVSKENGAKALKDNLLPFSRVRRIMKANQDVKMISAETPFLLTKAARYLIQELTAKSWVATTANNRRTLLQEDIKHCILKTEKFDFLVDVIDGTLEMEKQLGKYEPRTAPKTQTKELQEESYQPMPASSYGYSPQPHGVWSSSAHMTGFHPGATYVPRHPNAVYTAQPTQAQSPPQNQEHGSEDVYRYGPRDN